MISQQLHRSRQAGGDFLYEVVERQGRWRAREYGMVPERPWLTLLETKAFDAHEDAVMESADQRARRRQKRLIGFRAA